MNANAKKNLVILLLSLSILINILFIGIVIYARKTAKSSLDSNYSNDMKIWEIKKSTDFFDSTCPELEVISHQGTRMLLRDFIGSVIVIRFSNFSRQDLPFLVFLDHLYNRVSKKMHLFSYAIGQIQYMKQIMENWLLQRL
jgi:hypothetical protein